MTTSFDSILTAPEDLMFGLSAAYRADAFPSKTDLGVGAYRDEVGKPWVLPVAKTILESTADLNHEYLPITGLLEFVEASQKLVFGADDRCIFNERIASIQALSGTGALSLAAQLLNRFLPQKTVYLSEPPYANHRPILQHAGFETVSYPYYSASTKRLNLEGLLAKLRSIPSRSIVLLHACAHNPTGIDPSAEQWKQIASAMKEKNHLPVFDFAYQGFASGNVDTDAWPIRWFLQQGFETMIIAQSYAKSMGLYGERVGCLHVVTPKEDVKTAVLSQLKRLQRVNVSTPPAYGARIAATILATPDLYSEWLDCLKTMHVRIQEMRVSLRTMLEAPSSPASWKHLTEQRGMFAFSGLSERQVRILRSKFHIYTTPDGRFSMSGLNHSNVRYVAESIQAVVSCSNL